jgi:N-carbamoylputrescine amidase
MLITASFDLDALKAARDNWFVFRDRRPELYAPLGSLSGRPACE